MFLTLQENYVVEVGCEKLGNIEERMGTLASKSRPHGMARKKNTASMCRYLAINGPQGSMRSVKTTSKELEFRWFIRELS